MSFYVSVKTLNFPIGYSFNIAPGNKLLPSSDMSFSPL